MLSIYDVIRSCHWCAISKHISFVHCFFNVVLQDLGPIDQNYVLFGCAFDLFFDLVSCCSIVVAHVVNVYFEIF